MQTNIAPATIRQLEEASISYKTAGISIDTRTLQPGNIYIAIKGENFDGHQFVHDAIAKGAAAVIVADDHISDTCTVIKVADTRVALGEIAAYHRSQFDIPIIALTGSNGKTSTKEIIASILRTQTAEAAAVFSTPGNFNNDIGVPLSLLQLNNKHKFAVFELGANHLGEIAYTAGLVKPQVSLITNIAPAHIEGFGSIEGVAKTKSEIFAQLPADGIAVHPANSKYEPIFKAAIANRQTIVYGQDVSSTNISFDDNVCAHFTMQSKLANSTGEVHVDVPLPGEHHVANVLAAASTCLALGIGLEDIAKGVVDVAAVPGRIRSAVGINQSRIFDDSYNANPASARAAIQLLARLPGKRIFVLGDMGELGNDEIRFHAEIGEYAKQQGIQHIYTYGELSKHTSDAFGNGAEHFEEQAALINHLKQQLAADTACLVKGSRSMHMENVVAGIAVEAKSR